MAVLGFQEGGGGVSMEEGVFGVLEFFTSILVSNKKGHVW